MEVLQVLLLPSSTTSTYRCGEREEQVKVEALVERLEGELEAITDSGDFPAYQVRIHS